MNELLLSQSGSSNCVLHTYSSLLYNGQRKIVFRIKGGEIRKIQTEDILGLGIDISKNKADICLKEHSKVLQRFAVTNDKNGISMLLKRN